MKSLATAVVLALGALGSGPGSDDIVWYYDAEAALQAAKKTERPIVLLKVRADIGPDVKT
jgi:hypothetical protein